MLYLKKVRLKLGDEKMGISVIGGADGPTAIFVSSSVDWRLIAGTIMAIAGGIIALWAWKRNNRG
jgi:Na+-transporting methylmalonyl-CoA/oxaloacetate decarboxylase beta subunit